MKKLTFAVFVLTAAVRWIAAAPQPTQPRSFATPQEAAQALIDAASRNDSAAMLNLFGAAGKEIVDSRDATGEQHMRENFVARAHTSMRIESEPATLIGRQSSPVRTIGRFLCRSFARVVDGISMRRRASSKFARAALGAMK